MKRALVVGCVVLSLASPVYAQTVGALQPVTDNTGIIVGSGAVLIVNYSHPATAAGDVSSATLNWAGGPCAAAFKLKFFRASGGTYALTAERGPFASTFSLVTVPLSPPVTLAKGDLIGVVQLRPECGNVIATNINPETLSYLSVAGDPATFDLRNVPPQRGFEVNVRASADGFVREGVVPVAGSAAGAFGSNFRTSVSLTNGGREPIKGRLVFHPAGQAGSASDPSIPYTIDRASSVSFGDVVSEIGSTGLGTLDLISTNSYRPIVNVRIFDDRGAGGTSGFTEGLFALSEALELPNAYVFSIPLDTTNFRMNLGVRTLDVPTRVRYTLSSALGATHTPVERTYPVNFFEQVGATVILGPLDAGGAIQVRVLEGSAILYASTTDNRTNDSSAQFSKRE
ncbi:MAG: hypothetical protein JWO56_743 [Acidobacteria bacterium]|nr:hypothetical protein [Acidobacteriota bacterium]